MTPLGALTELLARVGSGNGQTTLINEEELGNWPPVAVSSLKAYKLLARARPARSAVCPGCERACVMEVHTLAPAAQTAVSFVVCDKRSDINRVAIAAGQLLQWRCDAKAICRFVAVSLGVQQSEQNSTDPHLLSIGMVRGDKRSQMLCLRTVGALALVVADRSLSLAELINYRGGEYTIDDTAIRQLVDAASTADPRYTPSNARRETQKLDTQARREAWRKAYRKLKKERSGMSDVWYSQQIAKQEIAEGRSAETIRKHMKT